MNKHLCVTAILHLIDYAAVREYLIGRELNLGIREYLIAEDFFQLFIGGFRTKYGAQNEAYMSRSAEKWVGGLCFNELGVGG